MKLKLSLFIALILFILLILIFSSYQKKQSYKHLKIGEKIVRVEIADTLSSRTSGLSNHNKLADDQGMLFVFQDKAIEKFWMKDMKFNLDIIWIADNQIIKIDKNLPAEGSTPNNIYSSDVPINYVLEVNAGWADKNDIKVGNIINYFL